jgi:hypothetical protein
MGKEWKKRHRYFRQWTKSERKDIDTSDNGHLRSLFAHCLKYLCLFFLSLPIVLSIYVFSFTFCPLSEVSMSFLSLCPLSEVSMSFLSLFVHCLMSLCFLWNKLHRYFRQWAEWKKRHRYFRQWAKSERTDIDTSDNGQRVKEKT